MPLTIRALAEGVPYPGFAAEGRLEWVWGNEPQPRQTYAFTVTKGADQWIIEVQGQDKSASHFTLGCDGKSVYSLQTFNQEALTSIKPGMDTNNPALLEKLADLKKGLDYQPAAVRPGVVPQADPYFANLIWLAFCSAGTTSRTNRVTEGSMPAGDFNYVSHGTNDFCRIFEVWGGSDNTMLSDFFVIGANHLKTPAGAWLFPSPYNKEPYTNFSFSVLTWTNLHRLSVPLTFRMTWLSPDLNEKGTPLRSPYRLDGSLTVLQTVSGKVKGIPAITRRMSVTDYRASELYGIAAVKYGTDPRKGWLAPTSRGYRNIARGLSEDGVKTNVRLLFLVFFGFLSVGYLIIVKRLGSKRKIQQNT
jgi:hypothetical protein